MTKLKNPKAKGSRRERQSKKLLEDQGYLVCKAGGSLGAFDLFCIGPSDVLLVQVKSNRRPSPAEMKAMRAVPTGPFVEKLVHVWKDREKVPREIYLDSKVEKEMHPEGAKWQTKEAKSTCLCLGRENPGHDCKAWPFPPSKPTIPGDWTY